MKVSEWPSLKSLRKLILMILRRDVAHSDQDLKLCSFSVGRSNIPPKRTTLLCAQVPFNRPGWLLVTYGNIPRKETDYSLLCKLGQVSLGSFQKFPYFGYSSSPSEQMDPQSRAQLPQQKHRPTRPHRNVLEAKMCLFLPSPRVIFMLNDNRLSQFA